MQLDFKVSDRVRLTRGALSFYGRSNDQGAGGVGTVFFAGERECPVPGGEPRPYRVHWDNGATNSYRVGDLEAASNVVRFINANLDVEDGKSAR